MTFVQNIKRNLINLPGWRSRRRVIVFESDDWGANRMPSRQAYDALVRQGVGVDRSYYNAVDTLESAEDFTELCAVLDRHRQDTVEGSPVFTLNTVLGNPDYDAIRAAGFAAFHHEHFYTSYQNYNGEDLRPLWREAQTAGLVRPQFHAREHLNSALWMEALQQGDRDTRTAFDHRFYGLDLKQPRQLQHHYLAAYYAVSRPDLEQKVAVIRDGLAQFEQTFGFASQSFIGCNYVWPSALEPHLADLDIGILQGQVGQVDPDIEQQGKPRVKRHYNGQRNAQGQVFLVRNCKLEPAEAPHRDWVDSCLSDIAAAFRWRKPAIISTHRANYVGGLRPKNRTLGLTTLDRLLTAIRKNWPDCTFLTSDALGARILSNRTEPIS
jgi:hypothetical protein